MLGSASGQNLQTAHVRLQAVRSVNFRR